MVLSCYIDGPMTSSLFLFYFLMGLHARYTLTSVSDRFWQDIPILVMVSMLAYFCFLEQLLVCCRCLPHLLVHLNVQHYFSLHSFVTCTFVEQVTDLQSRALAISLPFSCVLGLLSSMIASTMGD